MIKSLPISRRQRRYLKKKLLGVVCVSLLVSNNGMYCMAMSYNNSQNPIVIEGTAGVNTLSGEGGFQRSILRLISVPFGLIMVSVVVRLQRMECTY